MTIEKLWIHKLYSKPFYFVIGHFGCGKTMLGVEVAKILMARFLDLMKEAEVYVLTFNCTVCCGYCSG